MLILAEKEFHERTFKCFVLRLPIQRLFQLKKASYSIVLLLGNKNKRKCLLLDHLIVTSGASFYIMTFDKPVFPPG